MSLRQAFSSEEFEYGFGVIVRTECYAALLVSGEMMICL